ncbi:MAG: DUF4159 domain-containing protein [Verrucomicrobia bacterium]|nr:DUF4159 domain-containing protein [Verrucomicrobiota bacterium]
MGFVALQGLHSTEFPPSMDYETAREAPQHSNETPMWTNAPGFSRDVFTFVRVRYKAKEKNLTNFFWVGQKRFQIDFPDSDLNLSYRLQQMTAIKVNPEGRVLRITDPELFRYPWIYMVEPGDLELTAAEVPILRRYLLNGGFLMCDDFWGQAEWDNLAEEMKKVFPDREFIELPMEHPIFHCVFDLNVEKNKLQCPNVRYGEDSQNDPLHRTYEPDLARRTWDRPDAVDMHVRALHDANGRIMVLATHNTDNGDGWEREGEYQYYFREFSEKRAFPLGINIIFYAMTH